MTGLENLKSVAVVGVGRFGSLHAQKLSITDGCRLAGVYDLNRERAVNVASANSAEAFGCLEELIERSDAVVVATPTESHGEIAAQLLKAGKDVFLEKPMCSLPAEARKLTELAAKSGRILQVGHIERFSGMYDALKSLAVRPLYVEAVRIAPFTERGTDVSVVLDVMIHDIDLILGLVPSPVERVDALGAPVFSEKDDIASARIQFKNGCVANLTASRISMKRERRMRFFLQDRYVAVDFDKRTLRVITRQQKECGPFGLPIEIKDEQYDDVDALLRELKDFVACVSSRAAPSVGGKEGLEALETASKIAASLKEHRGRMRAGGLL